MRQVASNLRGERVAARWNASVSQDLNAHAAGTPEGTATIFDATLLVAIQRFLGDSFRGTATAIHGNVIHRTSLRTSVRGEPHTKHVNGHEDDECNKRQGARATTCCIEYAGNQCADE
eukprot:CAMPEP_0115827760 /NCGR_PEP_ID=MMETSP0287-20121206/213_1 /TAXON_ID=412157 /ORGANISM="Chrysochromulina rotalis, Strain UIO044" /LENGTH=117 /DNA_ID=CAMNT_0003280933 /DNA_START=561 /DNA_END=914 /DNA_ORIENTATION=+